VNHIFLSAASLTKAISQLEIGYETDLPVIGTVRLALKDVRIGDNRIVVPVHTHIPLASTFDVVLTEFRSHGTIAVARVDHVGSVPSVLISTLGCVVEALFRKALTRAAVSVDGDQVTIDFAGYLPDLFQNITMISMAVRGGIELTFDY
jgi:hypothetical protein